MHRDKSVIMLIPTFYPLVGGAEKQALSLSQALSSRGWKVEVLTRKTGDSPLRERMGNVAVERIPVPNLPVIDPLVFMVKSFLHFAKKRDEYGIIHVHLASSPAVAAILAGKLFGKKVVVKIGGGKGVDEISLSRNKILGRIKLFFFALTKPRFLVMNGELLEWLKTTPLAKCPVSLFRNGVDTGRYTPVPPHSKQKAKEKFGLAGKTVFLFVGRISPEKRINEFLEVWSEAVYGGNFSGKAALIIVGSGPQEPEIRKSLEILNISDSVVMAGKRYELGEYYDASDIFILPSVSEGLSNSMLEAMSSGLAVMASDVGGAKKAVRDGLNGFLFSPFDRKRIKEIILKFLETDKLALDMGEKSREIAVRNYAMSAVIEELVEIYKN